MRKLYKFLLGLGILFPVSAQIHAWEPSPWDIQVSPRPAFYPQDAKKKVSVSYGKLSKVTVYTKPLCVPCDELKDYLKNKNIKFEETNSLLTLSGAAGIVLSSERPPITTLDYSDGTTRRIVGFDEALLDSLLGEYRGDSFSLDEPKNNSINSRANDSFDLR